MDAGAAAPGAGGAGEGASPLLRLDGFAGELARLLDLARAHAVDLGRLSLTDCIGQVAAALEPTAPATGSPSCWRAASPIPLGQKADWLVMAAWLVLLRSRLLLPAPTAALAPAGAGEAEQRPDRRREWPAIQALAAWLDRRPQLGIDVFARGQPELLGTELGVRHQVDGVEFLWACLARFEDAPDAVGGTAVYRPAWHDLCSVLEARARLLRLLPEAPAEAPLGRLLPAIAAGEDEPPARIAVRRRSAVASTLLAGLELAREGVLTVQQPAPFTTITLATRGAAAPDPIAAVA